MGDGGDAPKKMTKGEAVAIVATTLTLVGGAYGAGYKVGRDTAAETKEYLQARLTEKEKELSNTRAENTKLTNLQAASAKTQIETAVPQVPTSASKDGSARVQIAAGETAEVFKGQLLITLVGIERAYEPFRYQASITLGAPEMENRTFPGVEAGARMVFEGYEVRVTEIEATSAFLNVQRTSSAAGAP